MPQMAISMLLLTELTNASTIDSRHKGFSANFLKLALGFFIPEDVLRFVSSVDVFPIEHVTVSFEWHGVFLERTF